LICHGDGENRAGPVVGDIVKVGVKRIGLEAAHFIGIGDVYNMAVPGHISGYGLIVDGDEKGVVD